MNRRMNWYELIWSACTLCTSLYIFHVERYTERKMWKMSCRSRRGRSGGDPGGAAPGAEGFHQDLSGATVQRWKWNKPRWKRHEQFNENSKVSQESKIPPRPRRTKIWTDIDTDRWFLEMKLDKMNQEPYQECLRLSAMYTHDYIPQKNMYIHQMSTHQMYTNTHTHKHTNIHTHTHMYNTDNTM